MTNQHTQQFNKEMPSVNDKYGYKLDYSEQGFMCSIIQSEEDPKTFYGYVRLDQMHPLWAKPASILTSMLCYQIHQVELVTTGYWMGFKVTGVTLSGMEEKLSCLIREITKFSPAAGVVL